MCVPRRRSLAPLLSASSRQSPVTIVSIAQLVHVELGMERAAPRMRMPCEMVLGRGRLWMPLLSGVRDRLCWGVREGHSRGELPVCAGVRATPGVPLLPGVPA